MYFFGLSTKNLINLKAVGATFGINWGNCPHCSPLATHLLCPRCPPFKGQGQCPRKAPAFRRPWLLVFEKILAQPYFAVVNYSGAVMSVFYPFALMRSLILVVISCCIVALGLFPSDILTWNADSLYSAQWQIN